MAVTRTIRLEEVNFAEQQLSNTQEIQMTTLVTQPPAAHTV